jgi:hypothetical protein
VHVRQREVREHTTSGAATADKQDANVPGTDYDRETAKVKILQKKYRHETVQGMRNDLLRQAEAMSSLPQFLTQRQRITFYVDTSQYLFCHYIIDCYYTTMDRKYFIIIWLLMENNVLSLQWIASVLNN